MYVLCTYVISLLQELNSYFISNHLKRIVTKNENGNTLSNNDRVELVRVAGDFLIFKNGSNPSMDARKSIALILHEQFPGLDRGTWCEKLTQRIKNRNRKRTHCGDHENENHDRNRNKAEKGHVIEINPPDDQETENIEYLNDENIDENDDDEPISLDSQESEDYETYELL